MADAERSTTFGRLLQEHRSRAGLTQEALAERAGLGRRSIQGLERGENAPHRETVERLARALSLTGPERAQFVAAVQPTPRRRRSAGAVHSISTPYGKRKTPTGASSLPVSLTSFIGREAEIARVRDLLTGASSDCRLLTLTGAPGVGKTRLAFEAALALADDFGDSVYVVPLAAVADPSLVLPTIAQALGVEGREGQPLVDRLGQVLGSRPILLVLDNFEQVASAAPLLLHVLERCPALRVLVTSRARLRVRGEHELLVSPLAVPELIREQANRPDVVTLVTTAPAAQLFVARVRALHPDFAVTPENGHVVAEICRRLDGLPLAIELAAARMKLLTPVAILDQLSSRLRLLVSGPRDLPARQQTLRAAIAWSEGLLDESESRLFRRLAVCAGGFTLPAAAALLSDSATSEPGSLTPPDVAYRSLGNVEWKPGNDTVHPARAWVFDGTAWARQAVRPASLPLTSLGSFGELAGGQSDAMADLLQGIEALVDHNLLVAGEQKGEPRFRMVETIREYGLEQLATSGELELVRRQHATYFLALAHDSARQFGGPRHADAIARLEADQVNLRTALFYWFERGDVDQALRMGSVLQWLSVVRGYVDETRLWLADLLALVERDGRAADRAMLLRTIGRMAYKVSDYALAWSRFEESLAITREVGDHAGIAETLSCRGLVAKARGEYDVARAAILESLEIWRELGNQGAIAAQLDRLGLIVFYQGDTKTARSLLEEALALRRALGDPSGLVWVLLEFGRFLHGVAEHDTARAFYEESLATSRDMRYSMPLAQGLAFLADLLLDQGEPRRAGPLLSESLSLMRSIGWRGGTAFDLEFFARLAVALDQPERALHLAGAAAALRERIGEPAAPDHRERLERGLGPARRALDEDAARRAEAEGRAITLEEAIAFALSEDRSLAT